MADREFRSFNESEGDRTGTAVNLVPGDLVFVTRTYDLAAAVLCTLDQIEHRWPGTTPAVVLSVENLGRDRTRVAAMFSGMGDRLWTRSFLVHSRTPVTYV